jgi:hypothetical protein
MLVLGQEANGTKIDLDSFLDFVCSNPSRLGKTVKDFVLGNPECMELANEAALKYSSELATIQPDEGSFQTAVELGLPIEEVLLANKISLMILLGYAHYLQWVGFDIAEPTRFEEISKRLLFARKAVVALGFYLALQKRILEMSGSLPKTILERYEVGSSMGATLGYLTTEVHLRGMGYVLDMLESDVTTL